MEKRFLLVKVEKELDSDYWGSHDVLIPFTLVASEEEGDKMARELDFLDWRIYKLNNKGIFEFVS
jgi:hypothetical protein